MKGHEDSMKAMFALRSHNRGRKNLKFCLKWLVVSDVVVSSNEKSLHCVSLIDVFLVSIAKCHLQPAAYERTQLNINNIPKRFRRLSVIFLSWVIEC